MNWTTVDPPIASTRLERAALAVLAAFTVAAVVGFAVFGMHPELLTRTPQAMSVYGAAFVVFARGQVLLASAALGIVLGNRAGTRWVGAFAAIYLASLVSELSGTTVGLPFGPYSYTDGLGPKWFGHVPVLIPLSWFFMAVPSFALAGRLVDPRRAWVRVVAGSLVLLSWDLALDPAMSHVTKYWIWGTTGAFYGMPWLNLVGWYVTGVVLMTILTLTRADVWLANIPIRWLAGFYAANLALSLGLDAAARLTGAVLASAIPLLVCVAASRRDSTAPNWRSSGRAASEAP
jgi:uncharacterized membrane protein